LTAKAHQRLSRRGSKVSKTSNHLLFHIAEQHFQFIFLARQALPNGAVFGLTQQFVLPLADLLDLQQQHLPLIANSVGFLLKSFRVAQFDFCCQFVEGKLIELSALRLSEYLRVEATFKDIDLRFSRASSNSRSRRKLNSFPLTCRRHAWRFKIYEAISLAFFNELPGWRKLSFRNKSLALLCRL